MLKRQPISVCISTYTQCIMASYYFGYSKPPKKSSKRSKGRKIIYTIKAR